jgi:transposase
MLRESTEGLSATALSKRVEAGYAQVLELLRRLEREGEVRRTGARRTSLWRLVTDEERIAERAAELESLAGR